MFKGVIIEESLGNPSILSHFSIISTRIVPITEKHKTPWLKQWTLHTVAIDDTKIDGITRILSKSFNNSHPNWYIHFWNGERVYVVFKDKIFAFDRNDQKSRESVIKYGVRIGIPEYQLDFPVC